MHFDPELLIIALTLAATAVSGSLTVAARSWPNRGPFLVRISRAFFLQTTGFLVLLPLRGLLPEPVSILAGSGLILLSITQLVVVLAEFQNLRVSRLWMYAPVTLTFPVLVFFVTVHPESFMRELCVSGCSALLTGTAALLLWSKKRPSAIERSIGIIFAVCALAFAARILFWTGANGAAQTAVTSGILNSVTFAAILLGDSAAAAGFLLLSVERSALTMRERQAALEQSMARSQIQSEPALKQTEAEYQAICNAAPAMLNTVDAEGRLTNVSNHWLEVLGYKREEVIGRSSLDFLTPSSREFALGTALPEFARLGSCSNVEYQLVTKSGKVIDVLLSSQALHEDGRIAGAVSVITDVTERRIMEQRVARAKRLESLAVLAAGIAHDFNNLLTGLFGHLQLIETNSPDMRVHAARAMAAFDRARGLTHQLLTFEKGGPPMKTPIRLNDMLRETADCVLSQTSISTQFHLDPEVWNVEGDPNQIRQVFENLLINAKEAMPNGGTIEFVANNLPPGSVRIEVADSGPGISELDLPLVFDPFFSTKGKGHGLGLASAYSIVKRHGGRIDVTSQQPGRGACFSVELPALIPPAAVRVPEEGARILILDEDDSVRSVLCTMLQKSGYHTEAFRETGEAVLAFQRAAESETPFDLVILDLADFTGASLELLERFRRIDGGVRAVLSSGYTEHAAMLRPQEFGFQSSIAKPWQASVLLETISRALLHTRETSAAREMSAGPRL